jgi:hypothetical protein
VIVTNDWIWQYGVPEFLGWPERDLLAGLDLDCLASRWVPSHPDSPLTHLRRTDRAMWV